MKTSSKILLSLGTVLYLLSSLLMAFMEGDFEDEERAAGGASAVSSDSDEDKPFSRYIARRNELEKRILELKELISTSHKMAAAASVGAELAVGAGYALQRIGTPKQVLAKYITANPLVTLICSYAAFKPPTIEEVRNQL